MPNYRGLNIEPVSFGKVSSDALFGPLDQEVFDFYEKSKNRYSKALDIGANIGVHTSLMLQQGWHVQAFEPDPEHFKHLVENTYCRLRVDRHRAAVSNRSTGP